MPLCCLRLSTLHPHTAFREGQATLMASAQDSPGGWLCRRPAFYTQAVPRVRVGTLGELHLFFIYLRVRHVSLNQGEYGTTGNSLPQSSIPQLVTPPPKPPPTPVFTNLQQLTSPLWLECQTSFEKGKKNK